MKAEYKNGLLLVTLPSRKSKTAAGQRAGGLIFPQLRKKEDSFYGGENRSNNEWETGANRQRGNKGSRALHPTASRLYETPAGLMLIADLPGVAPGDLEVRLEDHVLTIQGKAKHAVEAGPIYREFELANFFRQFELSEQVDQEKIYRGTQPMEFNAATAAGGKGQTTADSGTGRESAA